MIVDIDYATCVKKRINCELGSFAAITAQNFLANVSCSLSII